MSHKGPWQLGTCCSVQNLQADPAAPAQKLVFAQKMGRAMADVPLFGTDLAFNTWFPLTLVIYCTLLCALLLLAALSPLPWCRAGTNSGPVASRQHLCQLEPAHLR